MTTVTADIVPGVRVGPVSLDGFAAGPNQSADLPFGEGVDGLTFDMDRVRPTQHVVHVTMRPAGR